MIFKIKDLGFLLMLLIFSNCEDLYNKGNEIIAITASSEIIEGGRSVGLLCKATDQDGDKLSYLWESASGSLVTYGDSATWTAPLDSGIYYITCKVADEYGASAVGSIAIRVIKPNNAPVMIITSTDSIIKGGETVTLICEASDIDGDQLTYYWQSESGTLDNVYSDIVNWTAPLDSGIYYIGCTVEDIFGASVTDSIAITVTSVVPVNGLEWTITDSGLLNGENSSNQNNTGVLGFWDGNVANAEYGWNVTDQQATENSISQSLQFKVEDSENCGGENANTQTGRAIANIEITGTDAVVLQLDFSGVGEAQSAGYDLIEFNLDGVVIGNGEAPGGGLGCESAPVIVNPASDQTLNPGPHTLIIDFTTNDALYHVDAYYEIKLTLVAP